jgi:hypothetical protein
MSDMRDTRDDRTVSRDREPMTGDPSIRAETPRSRSRGIESEIWPDMTDLRQRFDAVQSEFIEDPKRAVEKAEQLVKEVVDRISRSMHDRMDSMHHGVEKTSDTEQLRQTMMGYRDLVDWMETRRAA